MTSPGTANGRVTRQALFSITPDNRRTQHAAAFKNLQQQAMDDGLPRPAYGFVSEPSAIFTAGTHIAAPGVSIAPSPTPQGASRFQPWPPCSRDRGVLIRRPPRGGPRRPCARGPPPVRGAGADSRPLRARRRPRASASPPKRTGGRPRPLSCAPVARAALPTRLSWQRPGRGNRRGGGLHPRLPASSRRSRSKKPAALAVGALRVPPPFSALPAVAAKRPPDGGATARRRLMR